MIQLPGLAGRSSLLVLPSLWSAVAGISLEAHMSRSVSLMDSSLQELRLAKLRKEAAREQLDRDIAELAARIRELEVRRRVDNAEAIAEAAAPRWRGFMRKEGGSMLQLNANPALLEGSDGDEFKNWDEFEDSTFNPNPFVMKVIGPNVTYNVTGSAPGKPAIRVHGRVPVKIFYESRCPYSLQFFNNTLRPLWNDEELRSYLDIKLYPYGNAVSIPNAEISEGYKFWHPEAVAFPSIHICQHGPEECLGNAIEACLVKELKPNVSMAVILCMSEHLTWSIEKASYDCMVKYNITLTPISECANGWIGNDLLTTNGMLTRKAKVKQCPTVFIGTAMANLNGTAEEFLNAVCVGIANMTDQEAPSDNVSMPMPSACSSQIGDIHDENVTVSDDVVVKDANDQNAANSDQSFMRIHVPMGASLAARPFTSYADAEGGYRPVMVTMRDLHLPECHEDLDEPSVA